MTSFLCVRTQNLKYYKYMYKYVKNGGDFFVYLQQNIDKKTFT